MFGFCVAMMVTFSLLVSRDARLSSISPAGSTLGVVLFATLLLVFPHNFLSARGGRGKASLLLRVYVALLVCWALVIVALAAVFWQAASLPGWAEFIADSYF